jgi:endonuclease YncB( thermonuclease family)
MSRRSRRFRRRFPVRLLNLLIIGAVLAVLVATGREGRQSVRRLFGDRDEAFLRSPESLAEGVYRVRRVVDGDTLLLANGARVRLVGADAPETVKPDHPVEPFGRDAASFTRQMVSEGGGAVRLQFDRERVDRYDRFLAYVWVGERMLNEELIFAGLATAETGFRYSAAMKTRFRRAETEARAAGRGIWARRNAPGGNL